MSGRERPGSGAGRADGRRKAGGGAGAAAAPEERWQAQGPQGGTRPRRMRQCRLTLAGSAERPRRRRRRARLPRRAQGRRARGRQRIARAAYLGHRSRALFAIPGPPSLVGRLLKRARFSLSFFFFFALFLKDWGLAAGARGGIAPPVSIPTRWAALCASLHLLGFASSDPSICSVHSCPGGSLRPQFVTWERLFKLSGFHRHVFLP